MSYLTREEILKAEDRITEEQLLAYDITIAQNTLERSKQELLEAVGRWQRAKVHLEQLLEKQAEPNDEQD